MHHVEQPVGAVLQATERLRALILDSSIEPAADLKQDELSRRLGVSRTPLRLALQTLAREGLVTVRHHRSATVTPVTPGDVQDLFDMRIALEPLALGAAFAHLDKVRLAMAEQCLDAALIAAGRLELAVSNWRFHHALYAPCGRPMLLGTISDLNMRATRAEIVGLSVQSRPRDSHDEHAAILAACRDRDDARAVRLLTEHLSNARAAALDAITP